MCKRLRAVTFDLDDASLISLREALPDWEIEAIDGAIVASLPRNWSPVEADLLVVGIRANGTESLELCRFLAACIASSRAPGEGVAEALGLHRTLQNQTRRGDGSLLVLVPSGDDLLVRAALDRGAHSCLMLPIHAKEVASMLIHAHAGNEPGRHTLNLEGAQSEDRWRDDGGQG